VLGVGGKLRLDLDGRYLFLVLGDEAYGLYLADELLVDVCPAFNGGESYHCRRQCRVLHLFHLCRVFFPAGSAGPRALILQERLDPVAEVSDVADRRTGFLHLVELRQHLLRLLAGLGANIGDAGQIGMFLEVIEQPVDLVLDVLTADSGIDIVIYCLERVPAIRTTVLRDVKKSKDEFLDDHVKVKGEGRHGPLILRLLQGLDQGVQAAQAISVQTAFVLKALADEAGQVSRVHALPYPLHDPLERLALVGYRLLVFARGGVGDGPVDGGLCVLQALFLPDVLRLFGRLFQAVGTRLEKGRFLRR